MVIASLSSQATVESRKEQLLKTREWIPLDSCSTDSVFNNCSFLHSLVACDDKEAITMKSNGGSLEYFLKS